MATPRLTELRLTSFKSFRRATMPLGDVTILTGRNSSGKSNALDALEVLSRLATGEDINDALDGRRREGGPVRGGSLGCAPHGTRSFDLGCTVALGEDRWKYDVTIAVAPELRITRERLLGPGPAVESGRVENRWLISTPTSSTTAPGLQAEIHNGRRGVNPVMSFRDNRLIAAQVPLRIARGTDAEEAVAFGAETVLSTLIGSFHLDPIPHLMRNYVPSRDTELRRTGENVSAALARVRNEDPETFHRIISLVQKVADERILDITIEASPLGDVTLALTEKFGKSIAQTPAREMSDGLLRFIAIATALLTSSKGLDIDSGVSTRDLRRGVLVVIEELENGLHPSQAARVLDLVLEATRGTRAHPSSTQVVLTTHSPALLNEVTGRANRSVLVCYRDNSGHSQFSRMTDLPEYAEALAAGEIGDAVSDGRLVNPRYPKRDTSEFARLLGID
ncbi:AAA family ATPase [Cellulomonas septica]|uniref:ATP-binding protein n=1 Tax=Cellulomonas septica TaxID=285080 RepID=A0ABX1JY60_9CELL|nr:ATP-binding protein [Cellulomonas septica]NKY39002.1 ATP-binding protein [Cellulomonas septica]